MCFCDSSIKPLAYLAGWVSKLPLSYFPALFYIYLPTYVIGMLVISSGFGDWARASTHYKHLLLCWTQLPILQPVY